jgi:serine/threonine protein kinase
MQYELVSKIGTGFEGNVFLCKAEKNEADVNNVEFLAIKKIHCKTDDQLQFYRRSVHRLTSLAHPHIVNHVNCFENIFTDEEQTYTVVNIVMEFCNGGMSTIL